MRAVEPTAWRDRLQARHIDAVVNCVGILMPSRTQSFERIHTAGPIELFRGAALAGVKRVVQISALGVGVDATSLATPYLHSKLLADDALAALPIDAAVLRPSLVFGPNSQSAALFATLASLPLISLPGRGRPGASADPRVRAAEIAVRLLERPAPCRGVYELGGGQVVSYREMLGHYRDALHLGAPLWLPLPMPLMRVTAWLAEALPQKVFCRDTIGMLERCSVPGNNAAPRLLGRTPSSPRAWPGRHAAAQPARPSRRTAGIGGADAAPVGRVHVALHGGRHRADAAGVGRAEPAGALRLRGARRALR